MELLERLTTATSDAERETIVLEMSLSVLSIEVQAAVKAAAIPHWFDILFLDSLLETESDFLYGELLAQSFVEQIPGKGYSIHERTRKQVLKNLWQDEPDRFRALSQKAAAYCQMQADEKEDADWQAEAIYHQLVSDPDAGVVALRGLATRWANYEYHTYDEIEQTIRLANEQIEAGRLTGAGAEWIWLWQAKLALVFNRNDLAAEPLAQISVDAGSNPYLAAEVAQTRGDWLSRTGDAAGMERAWRTAYDLFLGLDGKNGQLDAYLIAEKMRQHNLTIPEDKTTDSPEPLSPPTGNALKLIDNIHAAWIEGVLHAALDQTIDLRMARDGGQPSNLVLHRPHSVDRPVTSGQRLSQLFAAANQSLLILGAPGSGKTITLLQLLDNLLLRAREDHKAPIPLLFNLSSFAAYAREKGNDMTGWLAEQAYHQYRLKRQTTRERLAAGEDFVFLLDGLDEVTQVDEMREQCVEAINQFMQQTPCGLVVCSRIGDYQSLQNQLALAHALVLQPLSNGQIDAFINQIESTYQEAMQQQIQNDWQLREALRSPLLLNLFPQAFPEMPPSPDKVGLAPDNTVEARRQMLFAAYVKTVFDQPTPTTTAKDVKLAKEEVDKNEKSTRWLTFLADRMQHLGTTLFFIEEMQPTWLPKRIHGQYQKLQVPIIILITWLIDGSIVGIIDGFSMDQIFTLFICLLFLLIAWPLFISLPHLSYWSYISRLLSNHIKLREQLVFFLPSCQKIKLSLLQTTLFGLSGGFVGIFYGGQLNNSQSSWLMIGIIGGLSGGLMGVIMMFLDTPIVDKRSNPGYGVKDSLYNALLVTALALTLIGPLALYFERIFENFILLYLVLSNILPLTFIWYGGLAWCQHWALRFMLARRNWLPWRLVPWLDEMVGRGLLRRVGGGYIFIHRSLLEYFAAQADSDAFS